MVLDWVFLLLSFLYLLFLVFNTGVLEQGCWQQPDTKLETQETIAALQQHGS